MPTSARKSSLLTARFDGSTGKRRPFWYGWRAIAAGAVLALLAGSGIAVASASAAEAHNHKITVTCQGITIHGDNYNTGPNHDQVNTVDVTIGNGAPIHETFTSGYDKTFPFPDFASSATTYSAKIQAYDGGYSETAGPATSQPCPTPGVSVDIPACNVAGGTVDFSAVVTNFDQSHTFTIQLSSAEAGGTNSGPTAFTPTGTSYPYPFTGVVPGHNYMVTVMDTTTGLSGTASKVSTGCPQDSGISVGVTECTVPGGQGGLDVTGTKLSLGRVYVFAVLDANNVVVKSQKVTADLSGTSTVKFDVPAGGTYKGTVTDEQVGASSTKTSDAKPYLPCPQNLPAPVIDPKECTTTSGQPDSSITFSATGLVPGRQYIVTVSDGTDPNIFQAVPFTAASSDFPAQTKLVPPGTYTVTVTDVLLTSFFSSSSHTIIACPLLPDLGLTPTQCSVPGGTASIALSVTNFVATRSYTFAVTQNGAAVGTAVTLVAPATPTWSPAVPALSGLPAGLVYRVIVTDTVVPSVMASGDMSLTVCPGNPSLTVQATCNVLGASSANVNVGQLVGGQNYSVTILKTSNSSVVSAQTIAGSNPTAALQFKNVPNGNNYTVNIANTANTLTGTTSFFLKTCDLTTLAFTGANPVGPAVAGIGFLQLGLMLLAASLVVRRRRTV